MATAGFDRTTRLWDVATGKLIRELSGHTHEVMRVAFSPNGKQIASGSKANTVRVWDWATGEQVRQIRTHNHFIHGVAFSPDDSRLVCGSMDATIRVWDTPFNATVTLPKMGPPRSTQGGELTDLLALPETLVPSLPD